MRDSETNSAAEVPPEALPAVPEGTPPSTVETEAAPPPARTPRSRKAASDEPQAASLGRIVHYVLKDGPNAGEHRPGLVVRVWSPTTVNLQVFHDGDGTPHLNDGLLNTLWQRSVEFSAEPRPGTWHWPERE